MSTTVPHILRISFHEFAREELRAVAEKWTAHRNTIENATYVAEPTYEERVRAAIVLLDDALTRLGTRTGDRSELCRRYLEKTRTDLVARVAAFESLGFDGRRNFNGDVAIDIIDRVANAHTNAASTERALAACLEIEQLAAIQQARDAARVERNASVAALKKLCRAATCPSIDALPSTETFNDAEQDTRDITAGNTEPMRKMLRALQQGSTAPTAVAKLWVVYEATETATVKARWQMYLEQHPESAPTAVAAE